VEFGVVEFQQRGFFEQQRTEFFVVFADKFKQLRLEQFVLATVKLVEFPAVKYEFERCEFQQQR